MSIQNAISSLLESLPADTSNRIKQKQLANYTKDGKYTECVVEQPNVTEFLDYVLSECWKEGFDPDLCIVSKEQYLEMFNVSKDVGIDTYHRAMYGMTSSLPPKQYDTEHGGIDVTYSEQLDGEMLFVNSATL